MREIILLVWLLAVLSVNVYAQPFASHVAGGWSGIYGLANNPVFADSKNKFEVGIGAFDLSQASNLSNTDGNTIWRFGERQYFSPDMTAFGGIRMKASTPIALSNENFTLFRQSHFQGPSIMVGLTKDRWKHSLSFTTGFHSVENYRNMDVNFVTFLHALDQTNPGAALQPFGLEHDFKQGNITSAAWADYALGYSLVLVDNDKHKLKFGLSFKLMQGLGASVLDINSLSYLAGESEGDMLLTGDITYGQSKSAWIDKATGGLDLSFDHSDPTIGFDIGIAYEFQPWKLTRKGKYFYDMDGKTDILRRDRELHTLSLGFSFVDIGGTFNYSNTGTLNNHSSIFHITTASALAAAMDQNRSTALDGILASGSSTPMEGGLTMALPTRFNAFIDAQPYDGVHVSFSAIAMINSDKPQARYPNRLTFTARYERPWYGVGIPVTYLPDMGSFGVGLQLRAGPVYVGTDNVINIGSSSPTGNFASFYAGLRLIIPHKIPRDRDKDKVSDKLDLCKTVPGPWDPEGTRGCPDRDSDGVYDFEDRCPDLAGPANLKGCPDADGDGIADVDDDCVDEPGLARFKGCPDSDGDGIPDKDDECPTQAGPKEFLGCPDSDGDGIPDVVDECPFLAGDASAKGCPDEDGDGVKDADDLCKFTPKGLKVNERGCPDKDQDGCDEHEDDDDNVAGPRECGCVPCADSDGDGIPDNKDACPDQFGPAWNKGCPEIAQKSIKRAKQVRTYIEDVTFNPGSSKLLMVDERKLDAVAKQKLTDPNMKWGVLMIEGLADGTDNYSDLRILANSRAEAVRDYLMRKGVAENQMKLESRPAASEDEGNTKRVTIYFLID